MYEGRPKDESYGAEDYFAHVNTLTEQPIFNVGNKSQENDNNGDVYRPLGALGVANTPDKTPDVKPERVEFPMSVTANSQKTKR